MDWLGEHLRLIALVGSAIAYWYFQRKKAKEAEEASETGMSEQPRAEQSTPPTRIDDDSERVRRIQEEIRRKILERAGGQTPRREPVPATPAVNPPPMPSPAKAEPDETNAYRQEVQEERTTSIDDALLERQRELAEKFRELEDKRRQVAGMAESFREKKSLPPTVSDGRNRSLIEGLRDPAEVRKAIVLREVLGTPVGLR
ncbi:MAG: hypothetical protein QM790_18565 [Nibricoccus sp.]